MRSGEKPQIHFSRRCVDMMRGKRCALVRLWMQLEASRGQHGATFFFCSFRFEGTVVERFVLKLNMFAFQVEDCEKAYFKMDNVLIDDRRIHVDFSQSVSKIKWKGKGVCVCFVFEMLCNK